VASLIAEAPRRTALLGERSVHRFILDPRPSEVAQVPAPQPRNRVDTETLCYGLGVNAQLPSKRTFAQRPVHFFGTRLMVYRIHSM
jgi:hypothetical protein